MAIVLGPNQYGKAENRLVRVTKHGDRHEFVDLNVSVALAGDMEAVHLEGDNATVLPTDTMKNTIYAFAKEARVGQIEEFAHRLARHFVDDVDTIDRSRVTVTEYPWTRLEADGQPHPHAFMRAASYERVAVVTYQDGEAWVVSGIENVGVLKTTGSEFWGYIRDEYTTLPETRDRILATSVSARWWHTDLDVDWGKSYQEAKSALLETFAKHHSLSVQQTLYLMGEAVLAGQPGIAEIRLSMPNKHHFVVDLSPFGLDNPNEVFFADDRPYGLIEGTVRRDDAPDSRPAFDLGQSW